VIVTVFAVFILHHKVFLVTPYILR